MVADLGICGLIGLGIGWLIGVACRKRRVVVQEGDSAFTGYDLNDVLRLAGANNAVAAGSLFAEYKVNREMPEFYGKYVMQNRRARDRRYALLLELLGQVSAPEKCEAAHHRSLSLQDRLLVEMHVRGVSNKIMAQVLGVNAETLKKRKTRLKMKINEVVMAEDVLSLRQPVSV